MYGYPFITPENSDFSLARLGGILIFHSLYLDFHNNVSHQNLVNTKKIGNNGGNDEGSGNSHGDRSSDHENVFHRNAKGAVTGGFMGVFFGMSAQSPFESSSCQNESSSADRVKLFVDKNKFVLSQSLSNIKQQHRLEKSGNMFNGKLYDEKNLRTVKVDPTKLHCELKNSSETSFSSTSPVMTCGAKVVANVKEAVTKDSRIDTEMKHTTSKPLSPLLKTEIPQRNDFSDATKCIR